MMGVQLQIDGVGNVEVGDDFNQLSPQDQNAFVAHIAKQAANGIQSSLGGPAQRGPWNDYAKPGPWNDYPQPSGGTRGAVDFSDLVPKGGSVDFSDLIPRSSQSGAPIEVEGPGGIIVEFPAGTSRDVMTAARRKRFLWKAQPQTESLPHFDAMGNPTGSTVDAPVAPQMPYGDQMMNVARDVGGVSKVLANGMTMGLADQGVAALRAATGNAPNYPTAIQQEQAQTNAVGADTPGLNTALQASGGLLGGLGLLRSGLSLGGAAMNAGKGIIPRAAGFGADAAIAGGVGGATGVTSGNPSDYLQAAKTGAEIGGLLGGSLPVAGSALGAAYRTAAPFFAQPATGMGRTATGLLSNAMTPRAEAALTKLGPEAVLADASPSFQGLAQGVAAKPGPAADMVVDALTARAEGQPARLAADLNTNLGPAMSPVALEGAMTARQKAASPLYEKAFRAHLRSIRPTLLLRSAAN
jgi:hypothetical protein